MGDHRAGSRLRPDAERSGGDQQAVRRDTAQTEGVTTMQRTVLVALVLWSAAGVFGGYDEMAAVRAASGVEVKVNEAAKRVDVTIDGKPFTAYIWPSTLKKPVLYPLRTARGTVVTRGFPLDPREGERVDHAHHVGLWLNHGDVNGLDFWNNSDAIPAAQAPKLGTNYHRR